MGRPLKRNFYRDPAFAGFQFDEVDAWVPGESGREKCFITRQAGTYKFICSGKTSSNEGSCRLVDKDPASLAEGEMVLTCTPFGSSTERIRSLTTNKVRTFNGNQYTWQVDLFASATGEADLDQLVPNGDLFNLTVGEYPPAPNVTYGYLQASIGDLTPTTFDLADNENALFGLLTVGEDSGGDGIVSFLMQHIAGTAVPSGAILRTVINKEIYDVPLDAISDANQSAFILAESWEGSRIQSLTNFLASNVGNIVPFTIEYIAP